ncbi:MAG: hypothetical protein ABJI96_13195 [Paracoccaceae bacterium]
MIAPSALKVLSDDINELILVVTVIKDVRRDTPIPMARWADNDDHVARCQVR